MFQSGLVRGAKGDLPLVIVEVLGQPYIAAGEDLVEHSSAGLETDLLSSQQFPGGSAPETCSTLKGHQTKICVDPAPRPRCCRACQVLMLRIHVWTGSWIVWLGVIEPVEFSDWAVPIVLVLTLDQRTEICLPACMEGEDFHKVNWM